MLHDLCHVISGNHAIIWDYLQQKLIPGKAGNDYLLLLWSELTIKYNKYNPLQHNYNY